MAEEDDVTCPWHSKRVQRAVRRMRLILTQPEVRLPGEPRRPQPHEPPICWAVFMGCNTAKRLAEERGISYNAALDQLTAGVRDGWLFKAQRTWQVKSMVRRDC